MQLKIGCLVEQDQCCIKIPRSKGVTLMISQQISPMHGSLCKSDEATLGSMIEG